MSKKKMYYWLKLEKDFFDKIEVKRLRRMAGGDTYTIIYLKMLLLSLKDEGNLFYDGIGDDFVDELALDIDEKVDDVKMVCVYLENKNLMEVMENDEYHLNELPTMVGKETDSAKKMRRMRSKEQQKQIKRSQSDHDVIESDTEIEKELELDLELEKDKSVVEKLDIDYNRIIDYLNKKANKKFRASTKKTQSLIRARHEEGFKAEDFKSVIDKKVADNKAGYFKDLYLRPETLFGTKFEGYLNQKQSLGNNQGGLLGNESESTEQGMGTDGVKLYKG